MHLNLSLERYGALSLSMSHKVESYSGSNCGAIFPIQDTRG